MSLPDTELAKRLSAQDLVGAVREWSFDPIGYSGKWSFDRCEEAATELIAAALSAARAEAMREAAEKVRNMQRHYEQYLQKYPDEQISDVRAALCESLAKQFDALAAGQGGENG